MGIEFNGNFYDADYFERGRETGKGWLQNYHWMPRRSFKEAFGYIDYLGLNETHYVLDFGCAKGFIVRALRELEIMADGCDISTYALQYAPRGCWDSSIEKEWLNRKYTHVLSKDVFEHLTPKELNEVLKKISTISNKIMCIVPMGDNGVYRIKEYHTEISHIIIENEEWWKDAFVYSGWKIISDCNHVPGIKDNWMAIPNGNHVFELYFQNES